MIDFKMLAEDLKPIHDLLKPKADETPPLSEPPDDYFDERSEQGFEKVKELPPIVDAAEFNVTEFPKPPELVKGLIHQGTKVIVGGGSKSYKTWSQLDLCVSVAYGLPWMGHECTPGRVLFVNMEIPPYFFQQRLKAIMERRGIEHVPDRMDIWNLRGFTTNYRIIIPQIIQRIKEKGYSLVDLDPIYKIYGNTDENSASEVSQLLNSLEHLCVETGATTLFGAHYSKGNQATKESIDRISGSGAFARDPDSIINFTKHENEGSYVVEPTLRNLPPIDPFVVTWNFPLFERDDSLSAEDLKQQQTGRPQKHTAEDLLGTLQDGMTSEEWEAIAKEAGISRSTFFRLKGELVRLNLAFNSKVTGKWNRIIRK